LTSAFEILRGHILNGELPPGSRLVETALAEKLGVSRTPIREALVALERESLIERTPLGIRVRERRPSEILEIYEVRIVLEATAARAASERHTDLDRMRLRRWLAKMEARHAASPEELADLNRSFHNAISRASHNQVLIDLIERLHTYLSRYPSTTYAAPGRRESSLEEHRALVAAVLNRDGDAAAAIAADHMTEARDLRLQMWEDDIAGPDI
jgi:DNA-binding GntR family transcriptional regulator